jgi:CDP-diacylglycerol---glycerol-3-phosphate 3-phosphatidyltransferase
MRTQYACFRGEEARVTIYALKPRFQSLLRPLARVLHRQGVTANQVTIAACAGSVVLGLVLALNVRVERLFLLAPLWLFVRMAMNALDGMLAREFGQASPLGAYLNELADVISDTAICVPFALLPGTNPWLIAAIACFAIISEMAGALAPSVGAARRYDGPMGKSDRAFVFGAVGLLVGAGVPVGPLFNWMWAAVLSLLILTIINRVRRGVAAAREKKE